VSSLERWANNPNNSNYEHATNYVSSVIFLLLFVSRSKLVPDFALTIHFLHLVATILYTHSLPSNLLWWGLQCTSAAMMTFGGMWACQHRELKPIAFGGLGASSQTGSSSQQPSDSQAESSFGRGRGRERNLQEYEMDEMKATGEYAV
jgi:hypothetical protein